MANDRVNEWNRRTTRERREEIFRLLGNKCAHCGFTDPRALQIDHVNGGGKRELRKTGCRRWQYGNMLKLIHTGTYQLLCANCNWIKRHVLKEGPFGKQGQ